MAIIDQLDDTYPDGSVHKVYVLDDDLRALKKSLKDTFTGITGEVTVTHTELNHLDGLIGNVQEQIDALGVARQGLLSRGKVFAGHVDRFGAGTILPDGWSSERRGTGLYTVTMEEERSIQAVHVNIDAVSVTNYWRLTLGVGEINTTDFGVRIANTTTSAAEDSAFYFHVHTN